MLPRGKIAVLTIFWKNIPSPQSAFSPLNSHREYSHPPPVDCDIFALLTTKMQKKETVG